MVVVEFFFIPVSIGAFQLVRVLSASCENESMNELNSENRHGKGEKQRNNNVNKIAC